MAPAKGHGGDFLFLFFGASFVFSRNTFVLTVTLTLIARERKSN